MTPPSGSQMLESLKVMMKEAFEGPPEGRSWFAESKPGTGLFGTLENVSAEKASRPVPTRKAPIAAHVDHVRYYLTVANALLRGESPKTDWSLSWKIRDVNEETWKDVKRNLRREYETFMNNLDSVEEWNEQKTNIALATLAHSAYHLGSLRQMIRP